MADFITSFNEGIEEAKKRDTQRSEIASVFSDLNKQVYEASGGKIRIVISNRTEEIKIDPERSGGILATTSMDDIIYGKKIKKEKYQAISGTLAVTGDGYSLDIARWETDAKGGFPCTILYDNNNIGAYDKASLEVALQSLISSASAGEVFMALMAKADNQ